MRSIERNNVLLLAFFVFIIITRIYYFNYFSVPDSDFFDMRDTAISCINFELPKSYQRLPLYSCMMGFLSKVLPGKEPILFAGEIINLAAFVISCLFLYLISERFLGKVAFLVVYIFAMHPLTLQMTVQPIAQMLTVTLVLMGIYLAYNKKKSAYVVAFFASLTRYEGFLLLPSLVIKDIIFSKRKFIFLILGLLSSLGLILWIILNYHSEGHINPYYVYFGPDNKAAGLEFLKVTIATLSSIIDLKYIYAMPLKVIVAISVLSLTTIGFYDFFKKSFKDTLPILIFFLGSLFLNFRFFSPDDQHVFIILWILILSIVAGFNFIINFIRRKFKKMQLGSIPILNHKPVMIFFAFIIFLLPVLLLLNIGHNKATTELISFYLTSCSILIWFIFGSIRTDTFVNIIIIVCSICFISFFNMSNVLSIQKKMASIKNPKIELKLLGKWFSKNAKDGEKIVVSQPQVAGYYAEPSKQKDFAYLGSIKANSPESLISELKEKKITYVAWDSSHGLSQKDSYYYNKYKMFLISNLKDGHDVSHFKLTKKLSVGHYYAYVYKFIP
jgi:hypothetical protein